MGFHFIKSRIEHVKFEGTVRLQDSTDEIEKRGRHHFLAKPESQALGLGRQPGPAAACSGGLSPTPGLQRLLPAVPACGLDSWAVLSYMWEIPDLWGDKRERGDVMPLASLCRTALLLPVPAPVARGSEKKEKEKKEKEKKKRI